LVTVSMGELSPGLSDLQIRRAVPLKVGNSSDRVWGVSGDP
jgi:hypothetical protein